MTKPVMILSHKRPEKTRQVLQTIFRMGPAVLFYVVDGPRDRVDEADKVEAVRSVVKEFKWECEVVTIFHNKNLGAKQAMMSGLDQFFSSVSSGIILEDDNVPNDDFYRFAIKALDFYKNEDKVGLICGTNFMKKTPRQNVDGIFTEGQIGGWATWANRWNEYRRSSPGDKTFTGAWKYYGPNWPYRRRLILAEREGKLDAWDIPWLLFLAKKGKFGLIPTKNTVTNTGYGMDSTHTSGRSRFANLPTYDLPREISLPRSINMDRNYQARYSFALGVESWVHRLRRPLVCAGRSILERWR